jgi:hypothetical protein
VLCYLADEDIPALKDRWGGESNRGVHYLIRSQGFGIWPQKVRDLLAPPNYRTGEVGCPYNSVIYLHGSTCSLDVELAMTLAHELQHFLQFANHRQPWAISALLRELPYLPTPDLQHFHHLPTEWEARVIGKRVAEHIFGKSLVQSHIDLRILESASLEETANWEFISTLQASEEYDITAATIALVTRHRQGIVALQRSTFSDDPDLGSVSLDL